MDFFEEFEQMKPLIDKFFAECIRELFGNLNNLKIYDKITDMFYSVIDNLLLYDFQNDSGPRPVVEEFKKKEPVLNLDNYSADFKRVIDYFDKSRESQKIFMKNFPKWERLRKNTIKKLDEIAKEMNENKLKCNVTRVAGSTVGLLSGIGFLASVVFPPLAVVAMPMAVGGVSGAVVAIGGDVMETVWRDKLKQTARTEVSNDQKSFSELMDHFQRTALLKSELEKIINYKDLSEVLKLLKPFCLKLLKRAQQMKQNIHHLPPIFAGELRVILKPMIQMLINEGIMLIFRHYARYVIIFVIASYIAFDLFASIIRFLVDEDNALNLALSGTSVAVNVGKAFSFARATSKVATVARPPSIMPKLYLQLKSLFTTEKIVPKVASTIGSKVAVSLSGVGIVIDLATICFNASDVLKGSISEHATKLKNTAEELNKELIFLQLVFANL